MQSTHNISKRLQLLLIESKQNTSEDNNIPWTYKTIAKCLKDEYCDVMLLIDCVNHAVAAYQEALSEPRFQMPCNESFLGVVLSPVKGHFAIDAWPNSSNLTTTYTVEQFYNSIIGHILGQLSVAHVGWCKEIFNKTS